MVNNKFKIVIPSYNNEKWIEHNTASIIRQTYKNYDVLYINDKSTDKTLELILRFTLGLAICIILPFGFVSLMHSSNTPDPPQHSIVKSNDESSMDLEFVWKSTSLEKKSFL